MSDHEKAARKKRISQQRAIMAKKAKARLTKKRKSKG